MLKVALCLSLLAVILLSASASESDDTRRQKEITKRQDGTLQNDEVKERQGSAT